MGALVVRDFAGREPAGTTRFLAADEAGAVADGRTDSGDLYGPAIQPFVFTL